MSLASLKTTTALVASLSLILPHPTLVSSAWAQEVELLCRDESEPPCPTGEPEEGSTPEERAEFEAEEAARLAAEAERREAEAAAAAEAERLEAEAAEAAETERREAEAAEAAEAERLEAEAAEAERLETEAAEAAEAERLEAEAAEAAEAERLEAEAAEAAEAERLEAEAAEAAEAERLETEAAEAAEAERLEAEAADAAEAERLAAEAAEDEELALIDPTADEEEEAPVAATMEAEAEPEDVVEEALDAASVRTSEQDFATAIGTTTATQDSGRSGLSNLEKALLLGLGAVAVGAVLRNGDRVVENTGDRVVVEGTRGYTVYKDDDALLRQPGASLRTETFSDGSSRTFLDRADGSQVETIRDSRGRVLRRAVIYPDGTEFELFDDLEPAPVVDVRQLQATRPASRRSLSVAENDLAALRLAIREDMAFDAGRTFSLRQIREIEQVRSLVPAIELDTITFATGSAAIPADQARSLVRLGILIEELLFDNPREVFLIEGHTDAVGSESFNLALSDRRAETVALALTETFRIPPENLIVQGYGEAFLKIPTQAAEPRNRRATVRRITPLLRQIAAN